MNRRTALVTGANRPPGLGFAVARQLAEQDHHVILTARDLRQADDRASELRRIREAARGVVWAATLDADGPAGGLFLDGRPVEAASP